MRDIVLRVLGDVGAVNLRLSQVAMVTEGEDVLLLCSPSGGIIAKLDVGHAEEVLRAWRYVVTGDPAFGKTGGQESLIEVRCVE